MQHPMFDGLVKKTWKKPVKAAEIATSESGARNNIDKVGCPTFEPDAYVTGKTNVIRTREMEHNEGTTFLKFLEASRLKANAEKSSIYITGVSGRVKYEILQHLRFSEGSLPFKYLGVPLAAKKLSISQCWPLVEKITARINCWTSKLLSYAGRVHLIKSVLFRVQSYWAQIFLLPKKAAGGLNIMDLERWNKAAITKHLWAIAMKKDSMRIKWIHSVYIKNKRLESIIIPKNAAWVVRKILATREQVCANSGKDE
ncbi:uncharacterized protein LOC124889589 [Capsicum annuum]|uniref:uncharacterized protein LOC124889589 n=1 Tax=Capsicum annuum TaxID=4072 RepID=UPI001FB0A921|nr:uncharacterized protein LOC124889589 [Capsicum annuum]